VPEEAAPLLLAQRGQFIALMALGQDFGSCSFNGVSRDAYLACCSHEIFMSQITSAMHSLDGSTKNRINFVSTVSTLSHGTALWREYCPTLPIGHRRASQFRLGQRCDAGLVSLGLRTVTRVS